MDTTEPIYRTGYRSRAGIGGPVTCAACGCRLEALAAVVAMRTSGRWVGVTPAGVASIASMPCTTRAVGSTS